MKGQPIFYTRSGPNFQDASNGVWMNAPDDSNPQQLAATTDKELGPPFLVTVSAAGDKGLVWYTLAATQYAMRFNAPYWALLDIETQALKPLQKTVPEDSASGVVKAIFSPDGSKVLYTYRVPMDASSLCAMWRAQPKYPAQHG